MAPTIFVIAGEKSGDLLGSELLKPLTSTHQIKGVIGSCMRAIGAEEVASIEAFQLLGILGILKNLPRLIPFFLRLKRQILEEKPAIVILIDNIEFNLFMAKHLRKGGFQGKIIQVVCPTIWAWRPGRKAILEAHVDLLLCLFPFEVDLFRDSPLEAIYIGHPIAERLLSIHKPSMRRTSTDKPHIALFPGSRRKEIECNLNLYLDVFKEQDVHLSLGLSSEKFRPLINSILKKSKLEVTLIPPDERLALMQSADFALAKCGTVTLELALLGVATIATYPCSRAEEFLFQYLFKLYLPHYAMPNILLGRRVLPEYIASFASVKNIKSEVERFLYHPKALDECRGGAAELQQLLKPIDAPRLLQEKLEKLALI